MAVDVMKIVSAMKAIDGFEAMPSGWNFGRGLPAEAATVLRAQAAILLLAQGGALDFEAFPEDEGGTMIAGYRKADRFEILVRADGGFEAAYEDEPYRAFDGYIALQEELRRRGWQSVRSSGSFTRHITVSGSGDTHLPPFAIQRAGYRSSAQNVWSNPGVHFATISQPFTRRGSEARPRSSGEFKSENLLQLTG